jgi:YesN/AraC family two-component response regulator
LATKLFINVNNEILKIKIKLIDARLGKHLRFQDRNDTPRSLANANFTYVLNSEYQIWGNDWQAKVSPETGVLIEKGEVIETKYKKSSVIDFLVIQFQIEIDNQRSIFPIFPRFINYSSGNQELKQNLTNCAKAISENNYKLAEYEFITCLLSLLKIHSQNNKTKLSKQVKNAIQFIKQNTFKKISRYEIADYCQINSAYLSTIFHKETGFTLIGYINHLKIEKAKNILLEGNIKIIEIADMFDMDSYSFSRLFKKVTGISPKNFNSF